MPHRKLPWLALATLAISATVTACGGSRAEPSIAPASVSLQLARAAAPPTGPADAYLGPVVASGSSFFTFVDGAAGPTAWSSADGSTWAAIADPAAFMVAGTSGPPRAMRAVSDGKGGVVVVGYVGLPEIGSTAAAWHSADGRTWRSAAIEGSAPQDLASLAAHDGTFVAAAGKPSSSRLYYSTDGDSWHQAAVEGAYGYSIAVAGWSGGFVGIGVGNGPEDRRVWTSPDGKAWTERSDWALPAGATAVYSVAGGLVAPATTVGHLTDPNPMTTTWWWSADGIKWQPTALVRSSGSYGFQGWGLVGDQFMVVGDPTNDTAEVPVFVTTDGRTWQRLADTGLRLQHGSDCQVAWIGGRVVAIAGSSPIAAWYGDLK